MTKNLTTESRIPRKWRVGQRLVSYLIAKGAAMPFLITGESMSPLLEAGDTVVADHAHLQDLRLGDVVVVSCSDGFVTHRFLGLAGNNPDSFWFKGDRGARVDQISAARLVGRVRSVRKSNGRNLKLDAPLWKAANRAIGVYHYSLAQANKPVIRLSAATGFNVAGTKGRRRKIFDALVLAPDVLISWLIKGRNDYA